MVSLIWKHPVLLGYNKSRFKDVPLTSRQFLHDGENFTEIGFVAVRQKGSHVFFEHSDGRTTTLPNHGGRVLARPLIREILREIEISPEEFLELIKNS